MERALQAWNPQGPDPGFTWQGKGARVGCSSLLDARPFALPSKPACSVTLRSRALPVAIAALPKTGTEGDSYAESGRWTVE